MLIQFILYRILSKEFNLLVLKKITMNILRLHVIFADMLVILLYNVPSFTLEEETYIN
jgi:hypothetical protein